MLEISQRGLFLQLLATIVKVQWGGKPMALGRRRSRNRCTLEGHWMDHPILLPSCPHPPVLLPTLSMFFLHLPYFILFNSCHLWWRTTEVLRTCICFRLIEVKDIKKDANVEHTIGPSWLSPSILSSLSVLGLAFMFSINLVSTWLMHRQPYVTGTSVLGLKYRDGVLVAADTAGNNTHFSYWTLRCRSRSRVASSSRPSSCCGGSLIRVLGALENRIVWVDNAVQKCRAVEGCEQHHATWSHWRNKWLSSCHSTSW